MTDTPEVQVMDLSFAGQRAYCARLGILPPAGDPLDAWYRDPVCQEVSRLLTAMDTQRDKMTGAAYWVRSALDRAGQQFEGKEVHTAGLNSSGEIGRHALDYDMAVAVYCALEDQLQHLVQRIRRDQGYDAGAFSRLEDHPELSPEDDQARRELAAAEKHLDDFRVHWTPGAQRRHLREHDLKVTSATGPLTLLHDQQHAEDLAALRAQVDRARAGLAHTGMAAHDGYAEHSHEVRADHGGVSREPADGPA